MQPTNVLDVVTSMPAWVSALISALALLVSSCSLFVSWRMSRRTIEAERVNAWIELAATSSSEWLLASVSVKNPSHLDIKVQKLSIDLPDFRLGDLSEAIVDDRMEKRILPKEIQNRYTAMPFEMAVGAGETSNGKCLIYQPASSHRRATKVSVMYWTMEPRPKWRILRINVRTRPDY